MSEHLKIALDRAACEEYLAADVYVTKETIQSRILEKVKRILGTTNINNNNNNNNSSSTGEENLIYVHPEISALLNKHFPPNHPSFDENQRNLARTIYSTDYHDPETIRAFCNLLENTTNPKKKHHAYRIFAVDGFRGTGLFQYRSNLRIPISEQNDYEYESPAIARHVMAVRELYEEFEGTSLETVAIVLRNAMDYVESSDVTLRKMGNRYLSRTIKSIDDIQAHFDTLKNDTEEKVLMDIPPR